MSKDPALLFYTSDFLTGTVLMSNEQVGKYIRLLCIQHQKGRLSKEDMLKICKTHDKDIFSKFKKDKEGLYFNTRLEEEAIRRRNYSLSRRENRLKKPKKDMLNTSKTYDKHMETETEDITTTKDKTNNKVIYPFNSEKFLKAWDVWKKYRKEQGQKDYKPIGEQAALRKLSKYPEDTALEMIMQSIENSWKGIFELKNSINGKHRKIDYTKLLDDLQTEQG